MTAKLLKLQGDGNQKSLDRILSSAQRMSTMVTQLLDLTRSRLAGGIPVERKQAELGAVISGIVDELRAAQPGRVIRWEAPGEILGAWDAERLGQVVSNLVGNALEYGDPERPIDVQLAAGGDLATFSVHSHGAPIAPELLPVLFEPYRRGDARNARSKGLGLGLFITQQIVHAHEGRVEVRSTAEEGTTFTVTLPRGSRTREVVSTVGPPVS
jgi:signal transduction histidine kinase